ncbi:asparagine synthase C-terminal domain-containing protein [Neptunomonas phycophila]|uniref:asparagine synthetase B family protein n=1 Tax=Neptunomonas phycophila TaxID=1572645 RepID=UPI0026E2A62A|nr:asparagine synthase C-terminal domain-containing protein [Neptunomonas phycophila]MDO6467154.1 asparagine synthase C-terminal domain-containing protein [Neptunomonas phycophila]
MATDAQNTLNSNPQPSLTSHLHLSLVLEKGESLFGHDNLTVHAADRIIRGEEETIVIAGHPYFVGLNTPTDQQLYKQITSANFSPEALQGSFVVARLNNSLGTLTLYTDKFATVPAFWHQKPHSRECHISSLLSDINQDGELSNQSLYDYVYFHMIPAPSTAYSQYQKLSAATQLTITSQLEGTTDTYWVPHFNLKQSTSAAALSKELRIAMKNAVERCIAPNCAAFLSGGLDSSTVAGMLSEIDPSQSEAYSIGFSAEGYDEMAYARITAKKFGINLHEYYVTPEDIVSALHKVIPSFDEPFGNSSALPAYFCSKVAKENNVATMLAGDGGDELFAGNERYAKQAVFEFYRSVPKILRSGIIEPLLEQREFSNRFLAKAQSYIKQAKLGLPARLQTYNFLERDDVTGIFTADFLEKVDLEQPMLLQQSLYNQPINASMLNRMMYLDWQITLADNDLVKVNNACRINEVNVRYPMLDDELVYLSLKIEDQLKLKGSQLRHFYKETFKNWLPDETIHKSKHGFGLPFGVWMETYSPLSELAYDSLSELKKRNIIQPAYIDKLIKDHKEGHAAYYGEMIWVLMSLEIWLKARHG